MSTIQQVGLVGNSVKVQRLPAASAATHQGGNRFYTLVGSQEGYITGHTYHTILSGDSYLWEDATSQGMLTVSSESEMTALLANENTRKYVKYVGESGTYIKDQIYELVSTADAVSFYELPTLENEGTSDDIAEGKEFINSKGEKIVGTAKGGLILNKYVYTFSGNNFDRLRNIADNAKGNINIAFVYNNWLWYGSLSFGRPNASASYIVLSGIAIKADDKTSTDVMYVVADTGNNAIFTITDINGTKTRSTVTSGFVFYVRYYNDTEIT